MQSALADLDAARASTLRVVADLDDEVLRRWPDPEFSPVGWHLGHVAFTEARWVLGGCLGDDEVWKPLRHDWDPLGRPKLERQNLPPRDELFGYLAAMRAKVRDGLQSLPEAKADLTRCPCYLAWFLACHEHQHRETIALVLTRAFVDASDAPGVEAPPLVDDGAPERVAFGPGQLVMGTDDEHAYDNEQGAHAVDYEGFSLDAHPVTCAAWARFMAAGGYADRALWSPEGWRWRREGAIEAPLGWRSVGAGFTRARMKGRAAIDGREAVCGVSHHEAAAYARFCGARLPTEVELEVAARRFEDDAPRLDLASDGPSPVRRRPGVCTDIQGNVWEHTETWFEPYEAFAAFPYEGYSAAYFDATHRVVRGGSFATHEMIARPTFRSWYFPHIRQVFAGARLAHDEAG